MAKMYSPFLSEYFQQSSEGKNEKSCQNVEGDNASEDRPAAIAKTKSILKKLRSKRLNKAAAILEKGILETLTYYEFPCEHHARTRTNNPLEKIMKEIRRRTRVVGAFPDEESAIMLVAARLRHIAGTNGEGKGTSI